MYGYIEWDKISARLQDSFDSIAEMRREFLWSQSTAFAAWHGKPIGATPLMTVLVYLKLKPVAVFVYEGEK